MQLYIDAIKKSKNGESQYILQKGSYLARGDEEESNKLLQDGCKIIEKFHNGVGYKTYNIRDLSSIQLLSDRFAFGQWVDFHIALATFNFSHFYFENAEIEDTYLDVTLWNETYNERRSFHIRAKEAKEIEDFLVLMVEKDTE